MFDTIPTKGNFLSTKRSIFIKAILLANKGEKNSLGFTYKVGFGSLSQSMHLETRRSLHGNDFNFLRKGIIHIGILGAHVLSRAYSIANIKPSRIGANVFKTIEKGEGAMRAHFMSTVRDYEIGDLVSTGTDLAEIIGIKESKYGYRCYRVRYLANPAIISIEEEWLPARYIYKRIFKKSQVRSFYENILKRYPDKKEELKVISEMPDEKLFKIMKDFFIDLSKQGILKEIIK